MLTDSIVISTRINYQWMFIIFKSFCFHQCLNQNPSTFFFWKCLRVYPRCRLSKHALSFLHFQNVDRYDRPWVPASLDMKNLKKPSKAQIVVAPVKGRHTRHTHVCHIPIYVTCPRMSHTHVCHIPMHVTCPFMSHAHVCHIPTYVTYESQLRHKPMYVQRCQCCWVDTQVLYQGWGQFHSINSSFRSNSLQFLLFNSNSVYFRSVFFSIPIQFILISFFFQFNFFQFI